MFRKTILIMLLPVFFSLFIVACDRDDKATVRKSDYELISANSEWREPLRDLLGKLKADGKFDEHHLDGYAVALFDLNFDAVPELIEVEGAGSSGAVNYIAYDLKNGAIVAEFSGGVINGEHSDAWAVYLDEGTSTFKNIEDSTTQGGRTVLMRHISRLNYDSVDNSYKEENIFKIYYDIEEALVDGELVENNVTVSHYYYGEKVSVEAYNSQYDLFLTSYHRIPETGMKVIRWKDIENKDDDDQTITNMVDALLNSEQKFIKVT